MASVQGLVMGKEITIFAKELMRETVVDVKGKVVVVKEPTACSQSDVELAIEKIFCVSPSEALPFQIEDASRSDADYKKMLDENPDEPPVQVRNKIIMLTSTVDAPNSKF